MKAKVAITVDQEVLKEIERLRGIANRSAFANHILKLGLKTYKTAEKKPKEPGREYPNPTTPNRAYMEA
jgi:metal-responsive CopG/Arc/MetJ family transcriptional regulator